MVMDYSALLGDRQGNPMAGFENIGQGQAGGGFDWRAALGDPNVQRAAAQMGSAIGGEGSVGEAIGGAADSMIRGRAAQEAAAATGEQQSGQLDNWQSMLKQIFGNLKDGNPLEGVSDNMDDKYPNAMKITPTGVTLELPNTAVMQREAQQKAAAFSPQRRLETMQGNDRALSVTGGMDPLYPSR